jgi:hypothetical protein
MDEKKTLPAGEPASDAIAAWRTAWENASEPGMLAGSRHLKSGAPLLASQAALVAAMAPALADFAALHAAAQDKVLGEQELDSGARSESRKARRNAGGELATMAFAAVQAGLLPELAAALVAQPEPQKMPWARIGLAAVFAAVGDGWRGSLDAPAKACARWLASEEAEPFWSAWSARNEWLRPQEEPFDEIQSNRRTNSVVAALTLAFARAPQGDAHGQACARVARLLAERFGWGDPDGVSWRDAGAECSDPLSRSYFSFERADASLFKMWPAEFWIGVASGVTAESKIGAWTFGRLIEAAKTAPSSATAKSVCAAVWSTLSRPAIEAFDKALPGASDAWLEALLSEPYACEVLGAFSSLGDSAKRPSARWVKPFALARGAASLEKIDSWAQDNPRAAAQALLAARASLEAKGLAEALPKRGAQPSAEKEKNAPKRRL